MFSRTRTEITPYLIEQPVLELNHRTIVHSVRREGLPFARLCVELGEAEGGVAAPEKVTAAFAAGAGTRTTGREQRLRRYVFQRLACIQGSNHRLGNRVPRFHQR